MESPDDPGRVTRRPHPDRVDDEERGQGHEGQTRRLVRVVVAVDKRDVARPSSPISCRVSSIVAVPVGERAHERVMRVLVPAVHLHRVRSGNRERDETEHGPTAAGHACSWPRRLRTACSLNPRMLRKNEENAAWTPSADQRQPEQPDRGIGDVVEVGEEGEHDSDDEARRPRARARARAGSGARAAPAPVRRPRGRSPRRCGRRARAGSPARRRRRGSSRRSPPAPSSSGRRACWSTASGSSTARPTSIASAPGHDEEERRAVHEHEANVPPRVAARGSASTRRRAGGT